MRRGKLKNLSGLCSRVHGLPEECCLILILLLPTPNHLSTLIVSSMVHIAFFTSLNTYPVFKKWFFVFEQESLHIFNLTFLLGGPVLVLFLHVALPFFYGHFDTSVEEKPTLLYRVFAPIIRLVHSDSGQSDDSSEVEGAWPTIKSAFSTATTHVRNSFVWTNVWIPIVLFLPSKLFIFLITTVTLKANRYVRRVEIACRNEI